MKKENAQICEIYYTKCFSKITAETQNLIRFKDIELTDMHDHNFTLIKNYQSEDELYDIIRNEMALRRAENAQFFKLNSYVPINKSILQKFTMKPQLDIIGFYEFNLLALKDLKSRDTLSVTQITNEKKSQARLKLDLEGIEDVAIIDFLIRKHKRREKVYFNDTNINAYIATDGDEIIGTCDLFLNQGIAKIEDFAVSESKQRQGYGATILKSIIEIALGQGATMIYLITDENDTVKEMYLKNGFKKIDERIDLFFNFESVK